MSTLNNDDLFLVESGGQNYQVRNDQMSTLNPTDLLLVEREGVQYKMEAGDMELGTTGALESPAEVLTPLNGAGVGAGTPYNPISSPIASVGAGGMLSVETSEISNVLVNGSGTTLTFADSTNLQYFQAGDLVQSSPFSDEVWSNDLTSSAGPFDIPATSGFDGNVDSYASGPDGFALFSPTTPIPITSSLEYIATFSGLSDYPVTLSCDGASQTVSGEPSGAFVSFPNLVGKTISSSTPLKVEWRRPTDNTLANASFSTLKIDGYMVIDSGVPDTQAATITESLYPDSNAIIVDTGSWEGSDGSGTAGGDTSLTKDVPYDAALVCSDDTELANMIGPIAMADENGDLVTPEASATDVVGVDGTSLLVSGVLGSWQEGTRIKGASIASTAPSPSSIVFTSSNGGTTAVTGTNATLASRVWTLNKSDNQTGPWVLVGEYIDLDANASQDGATPWSGKPTLEENTFYQVKVKYTSDNAIPVESVYSTFRTGDA